MFEKHVMNPQATALPVSKRFGEIVARGWIRNTLLSAIGVVLLISPAFATSGDTTTSNGYVDAGVGAVDITPTEPVVLAGSPTQRK
jgi:hypothetical protein